MAIIELALVISDGRFEGWKDLAALVRCLVKQQLDKLALENRFLLWRPTSRVAITALHAITAGRQNLKTAKANQR